MHNWPMIAAKIQSIDSHIICTCVVLYVVEVELGKGRYYVRFLKDCQEIKCIETELKKKKGKKKKIPS